MAEHHLIFCRGVAELHQRLLGDEQGVQWGAGVDVLESQAQLVFIDDGGGDFAGDDFFEQGLWQGAHVGLGGWHSTKC